MCFEGKQNREGHGPQSGQYLHSWGGVITQTISQPFDLVIFY